MTAVARPSYTPLGFSYLLALVTGFFQAAFWGFTDVGELPGFPGPSGNAGPIAVVTFVAWLGSVGWSFVSSKKIGWLSLIGAVPALTYVWFLALLFWDCAFRGSCI